jgi:hypothetical protein
MLTIKLVAYGFFFLVLSYLGYRLAEIIQTISTKLIH